MEIDKKMTERMGYKPKEIFDFLYQLDYEIYILKDDDLVLCENYSETRKDKSFYALHKFHRK